MAASFPNAKKTFTQLSDGVTDMEGVNCNVVYDEVEAVETMVGAMGSTQAYTDSYKNLLIDYIKDCHIDYKGAADIYVRAGEIAIPDASGNLRFRRNTSDTTVTWADIDTGAEANSTTYYVYAVADAAATTFTILISTNDTTPTGATYYRKLGSFYNDAAGDIAIGFIFNDNNGKGITQVVSSQRGDMIISTTALPWDDSIPENTEGTEALTVSITPKSAVSKLKITANVMAQVNGGTISIALFQDSIVNALAVANGWSATASGCIMIPLVFYMTSGTISAITFKIRFGAGNTSSTTLNGVEGVRKFGGVACSSLAVEEIMN